MLLGVVCVADLNLNSRAGVNRVVLCVVDGVVVVVSVVPPFVWVASVQL